MFPCPSCGGGLRFDIASQMLKCDYCDSTFDPAAYEKSRVGKESPVYEAAVFICPTCGGEMITADEAINGFCPYCGGQSYISRKGELEKPAYVIPFKVTKEDCKAAYRKTAFRSVFAPKELRDADALEEFRGIYMPYWFVENTGHGFLETTGKRTYRRGDYRITDNYHVSANVDYHVCDTAYEASASFDDKISDAIAPYDGKDIREFAPGYLTGFYADKADVPVRIFEKEAAEHTAELITEAMKHSGVEADELNENRLRDSINGRGEGLEQKSWSSLLPVWFLTWRDKDRVAYAVVNGQTGKVCADLPVDLKRYGLFCFLLAIPIFFLLNLFFTPTPLIALRITSIAAAISMLIYNAQLGAIAKRDKALGDELNARTEGKKKKRKKSGGCLTTGVSVMFALIIPTVVLMLFKEDISIPSFNGLGYFIGVRLAKSIWVDIFTAVLTVIPFLGILKKRNVLPGKKVVAPALGSLISVAICIVIFRLNITEDLVYYFAVAAGYIALLVTLLGVLQKYNYLATRPMPQVLRQGGDTSAPEKRSGGGNKKAAAATALALFLLGSAVLGSVSMGEKLPGAVTAAAGFQAATGKTTRAAAALTASKSTKKSTKKSSTKSSETTSKSSKTTTVEGYDSEDIRYRYIVDDQQELLSVLERTYLLNAMQPLTAYGNVLFVTTKGSGEDAADLAKRLFRERFGDYGDGVVFLIDMGSRMLIIAGHGELSKSVTSSVANSITDNIYRLATKGRYYECAKQGFSELEEYLLTGRVSQMMKYISNAFLAVVLGTLLAYWILRIVSNRTYARSRETLTSVDKAVQLSNVICEKTNTTRVYDPVSHSSGGGGGGRSGGGGGGGFSAGGHGF